MADIHGLVAMVTRLTLAALFVLPLEDIGAAIVTFCYDNSYCQNVTEYCNVAIGVCAMCADIPECAYEMLPNNVCSRHCPNYAPTAPTTTLNVFTTTDIPAATPGTASLIIVVTIVALLVAAVAIAVGCLVHKKCYKTKEKLPVQETDDKPGQKGQSTVTDNLL